MTWSWEFAFEIAPIIATGLWVTVIATFLGSCLALALGLVFALLARSPVRPLALGTRWLIDFIRGTPLLVQLYVLFFLMPDIGIYLAPLAAGIIGLGVHYAAYLCEVYRAGIENVPRGQWEAGRAINLTRWQIMWRIILPQAIPPMLPTIGNYILSMFKETPLLSVITVLEIMAIARGISTSTFRFLEPITIVGLYFLILSVPCAILLDKLEKRINRIGRM